MPRTLPRISNNGEWHDFIGPILAGSNPTYNLYNHRAEVYRDIEELRGRPLLVYVVKFPAPIPQEAGGTISITLEDVDGFTDIVAAVPNGGNECDVLIHSPGGQADATERIVKVLRDRFEHITFLVPHSAYSAATMLALSGNEVILHPSACLGPIDPQFAGTPARALQRGFERARDAIKEGGPEVLPAYIPLIEKVTLEMLELCDDALNLSKELVQTWLREYMFAGETVSEESIHAAADFFAAYDDHKTHSRPITVDKIKTFCDGVPDLDLKVYKADGALKDLLREAHILIAGGFNVTPFVKTYENAHGLSWGTQLNVMPAPSPFPTAVPPGA